MTRRIVFRRAAAYRAVVATIAAASVVAGLLAGDGAEARWTAAVAPGGAGAASAATVGRGPTPTATVATRDDVTVTWAASALSTGTAVTAYTVARYDPSGAVQQVRNGCSGTITATTCTEADVPEGRWTYRVTPRFAERWVGAESAPSGTVVSDTTPPLNNFFVTQSTGAGYSPSGKLWYRGVAAGSFRLLNQMGDSGSGPASSTTGDLTGDTSGWSHVPSTVSTKTGSGYVSNPFSWTAGTTSAPTITVTGRDVAGNATVSTLTAQLDNTGPTGGAISYADGFTPSTSVPVTVQPIDDAGVGYTAGGGRWLEQSTAPLNGDACGAFGPFGTAVLNPAVAPQVQQVPVTSGLCYLFRYRITDNFGNESITTSSAIVKGRNYRALVTSTANLVDYWRLSDTGSTLDDIGPANADGTYQGNPTRIAPGALIGDPDGAVTFDGIDDAATAPRKLINDFSVELWFRSTQGLGSGRWQDGAGLFSADVDGVRNDYGVSLLADGRVAAGTGAPDVTAVSASGLNDGAWHHVVVTRSQASGQVLLYVDGNPSASVTGGQQALDAATSVTIGAVRPGTGYFAGDLDEVSTYASVLSAGQVATHARAGRPAYGDRIGLVTTSGAAFLADAVTPQGARTVYYRGAAGGSLQLTQAIDKTGAGGSPSSTTSALTGDATGWQHTASTVSTPGGGPFTSSAFTWAPGTTALPGVVLTGRDDADRLRSTNLVFQVDDTGPTGGAISYADGPTTASTVDVTVQGIDDAGVGVTQGGGRYLQRATAPLNGDQCGTFAAYQDIVTNPAVAPAVQTVPLQAGTCSSYRYRFTDNLGNETVTTTTAVVRATAS